MAIHTYQEMKHANLDVVVISGSFQPNNTTTPDIVSGRGFSVVEASDVYTITFNQKFAADHLLAFHADVSTDAGTTPYKVQVDNGAAATVLDAANRTVTLRVYDLATPTIESDADLDTAGAVIMFTAIFQRSSLPAK